MTSTAGYRRGVQAWQVECFLAARDDASWADRVVITPWLVGVVDGSTQKPWEEPGYSGADLAGDVVAGLQELDPALTMAEAVRRLTERVRPSVAGSPRGTGPCATFAVLNSRRREVWRLGDPWVLLDGTALPRRATAEPGLARRRADVLHDLLMSGCAVDDLRRDDPGRAAILDGLRAAGEARNGSGPLAIGVVDGRPVPPDLLEVFPLARTVSEVILATDGYPQPPVDLHGAETSLARRLSRDPLLIEEPPMTKGAPPGRSFDDRTFVRVTVGGAAWAT